MSGRLKKLPPVSTLAAVFGTAALSLGLAGTDGTIGLITQSTILLSPVISGGLSIPATKNLLDKKNSKLSKAFSAIAAPIGITGCAIGVYAALPNTDMDLVAGTISSFFTMTATGALNVTAALIDKQKPARPQQP